ncbi:MAG: hypothetical protein ABWX74_11550 [Aeromicrobium sp.]
MRKLFIILAVLAVSVGTFSPAEAATKKFSVSGHADNRKMDLDSATGGNRTTKIKGKVKGGNVKGKTVVFHATNTDTSAKKRRYLGSAKLNSKGVYSKTFRPTEGGSYLIEVTKKAGGGRRADTKTIRVEAFEWPILKHFYNDAASNPDPASRLVERSDMEQTGTGRVSNERWSTSYAIHGTGKAVFDITGFKCWRFNLKLAVSQQSPRGSAGTFVVAQGGREIARGRGEYGGTFWEPSRAQSEKLVSHVPLEISIIPDADAADPKAVRFVLGNPKASCTYPTRSAAYR